jgi:hypothetical protein
MALVEPYELDGVTVGATELSIVSGTTALQTVTTDGIYHLWLDANTMAKGDYFRFRIDEKVLSTSTQRTVFSMTLGNAQVEPLVTPPLMLLHGWDMTLQKIAGTDRAFDASIRGNDVAPVEAHTLSAVTVGATEISVVTGTTTTSTSTTHGVYQLFLDATNMAKGDEFHIRIYEKVEATGGTQRQVYEATLHDVQTQLFVTPMLQLKNGWDVRVVKIAGTDRAFDASLRRVT